MITGVAALIRLGVKEPEHWKPSERVELRELFTPDLRRRTLGGLAMAIIALVTWWSVSVFVPVIASFLAAETSVDPSTLAVRKAEFITLGTLVLWALYLTGVAYLHIAERGEEGDE